MATILFLASVPVALALVGHFGVPRRERLARPDLLSAAGLTALALLVRRGLAITLIVGEQSWTARQSVAHR